MAKINPAMAKKLGGMKAAGGKPAAKPMLPPGAAKKLKGLKGAIGK